MDKCEIVNKVKNLKTLDDFVELLNAIKVDEFHTESFPVTLKQLKYFSITSASAKRYHTFKIKKKSGGFREISAPTYKLGLLLKILNVLFKSLYNPSISAMGFAEGRSVVMNASLHTGNNYVLNIDLQNFFPSITQARVWKRIQLPPFNFTPEIANVVAGICCYYNSDTEKNVLPQGSPTSPILSNAICDKLDRRMRGVAKRFGLHYSRYADDMTFSSMYNVYQEDGELMKEIKRLINQEGFIMNDKKTRLLRTKQRQEVTGLTVNTKVNVTRKYIHDLRRYIYVWERNGYGKAYAFFYQHYKQEKGYIKKGEPIMENVIGGKLNYLRMVKGNNNPVYLNLQRRFDALQQIVYVDSESDKTEKFIYVQSYTLTEFESLFHTKITLDKVMQGTAKNLRAVPETFRIVGRCTIGNIAKQISISKTTQKFLSKQLEQNTLEDISNSELFKKFYVTLCRKKGKNIWMITKYELKRSNCLSLQTARVDVDVLLALWEKKGIEAAASALNSNLFGSDVIGLYKKFQLCAINNDESPVVADSSAKNTKKTINCNKEVEDLLNSIPQEWDDIDLENCETIFGLKRKL